MSSKQILESSHKNKSNAENSQLSHRSQPAKKEKRHGKASERLAHIPMKLNFVFLKKFAHIHSQRRRHFTGEVPKSVRIPTTINRYTNLNSGENPPSKQPDSHAGRERHAKTECHNQTMMSATTTTTTTPFLANEK